MYECAAECANRGRVSVCDASRSQTSFVMIFFDLKKEQHLLLFYGVKYFSEDSFEMYS